MICAINSAGLAGSGFFSGLSHALHEATTTAASNHYYVVTTAIMAPKQQQQQQQHHDEERSVGSTDGGDGGGGPKVIEYHLEPTYAMEPDDDERFSSTKVKMIAQDVLRVELDEAKIDDKWIEDWADFGDDFESLSKTIADIVKNKCKTELCLPRYKILVQVTIGQMKDQGVGITSRCLWDTNTDNYASISYRNEVIWASCTVFGVYAE